MVNVPEFVAKKVRRVQGGTFPAAIWKSFTDEALAGEPSVDWEPAPPIGRSSVRLYLPGVDCVAQIVSGTLPRRVVGKVAPAGSTTTTVVPGVAASPSVTARVTTTLPPDTTVSVDRRPVVSVVDAGTTILPSNTNPFSPVPSVDPNNALVFDCAKSLPGWVQTTIAGG